MSGHPLTAKQEVFVREYLTDMNATQAAIRAGYSPRNPGDIAAQLLGKTHIQQAIKAAQDKQARRLEISQDDVVEDLWSEAHFFGMNCSHSARIRALELVGRHIGMVFAERHEVSAPGGGPLAASVEWIRGRLSR